MPIAHISPTVMVYSCIFSHVSVPELMHMLRSFASSRAGTAFVFWMWMGSRDKSMPRVAALCAAYKEAQTAGARSAAPL